MKRELTGLLNGMDRPQDALGLVKGVISEMTEVRAASDNEGLKKTLSSLVETFQELEEDCGSGGG